MGLKTILMYHNERSEDFSESLLRLASDGAITHSRLFSFEISLNTFISVAVDVPSFFEFS